MSTPKVQQLPAHPRAVYLMDEITSESSGDLIRDILTLDQMSDDPIRLFIYSKGGDVDEGNYIRDILNMHLRSPIITIGIGLVASGAIVLLNCGTIRLAFRKTKILFHEVYWEIGESDMKEQYPASRLKKNTKEYEGYTTYYLKDVTRRLQSHLHPCIVTPKELLKRINNAKEGEEKEYVIESRTAYELGFLDGVINNVDGIRRYERMLRENKKRKK